MEEKNFKWFVHELTNKTCKFSMLDAAICKGEHLQFNFSKDRAGQFRLARCSSVKVKHFLTDFLEKRCPKMQEFNPERIVGILYQSESIRMLTVSSITSISPLRVHSLRIQSIHLIPPHTRFVTFYRVVTSYESGEISMTAEAKFKSENSVEASSHLHKLKEMALMINSFIYKIEGKFIEKISFDAFIDHLGTPHLVKVHKVLMNFLTSNDNHLYESMNHILRKGNHSERQSPLFLEIMKKTFSKQKLLKRKVSTIQELVENLYVSNRVKQRTTSSQAVLHPISHDSKPVCIPPLSLSIGRRFKEYQKGVLSRK